MGRKVWEESMTTIKFHKNLYDRTAIESSVYEFSYLGKFRIEEQGNYFSVQVETDEKENENLLPLEFSNYVLNETISRRTLN